MPGVEEAGEGGCGSQFIGIKERRGREEMAGGSVQGREDHLDKIGEEGGSSSFKETVANELSDPTHTLKKREGKGGRREGGQARGREAKRGG
jgi:hypothetical protein